MIRPLFVVRTCSLDGANDCYYLAQDCGTVARDRIKVFISR